MEVMPYRGVTWKAVMRRGRPAVGTMRWWSLVCFAGTFLATASPNLLDRSSRPWVWAGRGSVENPSQWNKSQTQNDDEKNMMAAGLNTDLVCSSKLNIVSTCGRQTRSTGLPVLSAKPLALLQWNWLGLFGNTNACVLITRSLSTYDCLNL